MNDPRPLSAQRPRVSTLELFFDLVFVFTITQLTSVLAAEPTWRGLVQVSLMLGVIFWMYGGYAWLTNSVTLDRLTRRLTLLGGMAGFLVVALAIPRAFSQGGEAFGLAYLLVVLIHMGMFVRSSQLSAARAMVGLIPFNLVTALLVVCGGFVGHTAQYLLWASAFVFEWVSPKLIDDSGFVIEPVHFVERHGLLVIVAIGESVVAVGIGAAGLAVDFALVAAALLGLALSACLWWSYFGVHEGAYEQTLTRARPVDRPRLAINAFGYWHLPILFGVILIAMALKKATGQPFAALGEAQAIALSVGVSVFCLGEAFFRRTLDAGAVRGLVVIAVLAPATIPLGTGVAATAQLGVLVALFVAALVTDTYPRPRPAAPT